MFKQRENFNDKNLEFNELKRLVMLWLFDSLCTYRDEFGFTAIPNRGFTDDDQATLISMTVNYLFAEKQADEIKKNPVNLRDFVETRRGIELDAANVVLRKKEIHDLVITVLLRQYDIRTEQFGIDYEDTEEGQKVVSLLEKYAHKPLSKVTEESFNERVNRLPGLKTH